MSHFQWLKPEITNYTINAYLCIPYNWDGSDQWGSKKTNRINTSILPNEILSIIMVSSVADNTYWRDFYKYTVCPDHTTIMIPNANRNFEHFYLTFLFINT